MVPHVKARPKTDRRGPDVVRRIKAAARPARATVEDLHRRILGRETRVGVIGLGYVGLPLTSAIAQSGFSVIGFDLDPLKVEMLNRGRSYIHHIPEKLVGELVRSGRFRA